MLAKRETLNLSNNLKKKFLFRNDVNSATILIDLYQTEENLKDLHLRYLSMAELRNNLRVYMMGRLGRDLAASNLAKMIHSDINRIELLICIEGHRAGLQSRKHANTVEEILLNNSNIQELYKNRDVLNDLTQIKDIDQFKIGLSDYVEDEIRNNNFFREFIYRYTTIKIRPKIYSLNKNLDMQLIVEENHRGTPSIGYETRLFSRKELNELLNNIIGMLFNRCVDIFTESYWKGIEEKIRNRYR